jgi:hypothetical protein
MGAVEKKLQEELIMPLKQTSFVMISKSEEPYDGSSLDAISKTSVKLAQLAEAASLYFIMYRPYNGGTTALMLC